MPTKLPLAPRAVPLTELDNGVLRVTGTRISLERIVEEYRNGSTPEQIVDSFDSLGLADVYYLIAYYLDNKEAVDRYLAEQNARAGQIRQEIEANQPWRPALKEVLLKRWAEREANNAPAGE